MFVRRREGERPFVIAGNRILKCIFKNDDTLIGVFDRWRWDRYAIPKCRTAATDMCWVRSENSHIYTLFVLRNFSLASSKLDIILAPVSVSPLQFHEQETQAETFRCSLIVPRLLALCYDWQNITICTNLPALLAIQRHVRASKPEGLLFYGFLCLCTDLVRIRWKRIGHSSDLCLYSRTRDWKKFKIHHIAPDRVWRHHHMFERYRAAWLV